MTMERLHEDALRLAVDKNIADIRTLLLWAEQTPNMKEKVGHVTRAVELLQEVKEHLEVLS
jgi:hypothetical protein